MDEAAIITAIQAGDTDKFGLLYDAYFSRIYAYLFYRTRNKALTEDLVSVSFLKAINAMHRFNPQKGTFSSWLYRIARNTLYDHGRRKKPTGTWEQAEGVAADGDLNKETADRILLEKVADALSGMPQAQREVVSMRVWDGLSYAEIARILNKSEASCKMAFHRASLKLKTALPST